MSQTKEGPLLRRARFGASGNSDKTLEKLYSQGFVTSELNYGTSEFDYETSEFGYGTSEFDYGTNEFDYGTNGFDHDRQ